QSRTFVGVAISVESIADFLMVRGMSAWIEGSIFAGFRSCCVSKEQGVFVYVVERRGVMSMEPIVLREDEANRILLGYEKWQTRLRAVDSDEEEEEGMRQALTLAEELVEQLVAG